MCKHIHMHTPAHTRANTHMYVYAHTYTHKRAHLNAYAHTASSYLWVVCELLLQSVMAHRRVHHARHQLCVRVFFESRMPEPKRVAKRERARRRKGSGGVYVRACA